MSRVVTLPPDEELLEDGSRVGGWWRELDDGRILCELCPRACHLKEGDRGFCFVRENRGGQMVLSTYGRSTGFCIDPIEKKPLNHFYPGTAVLSFGTAGCNLGCKFCQNWDISKSREIERLSELATPEAIAAAASRWDCQSVAFTYNDPVIWAEYAIDVARACHAAGIKTVAVTAGYITPQARTAFYEAMDAANVDLKGFTEDFYFHYTLSHLQPVLETLEWLKKETDVWFEITNLIIPQANDASSELEQMCDWILHHIGDDTPVHFTAFHPDFRLRDRPPTPHATLLEAHAIARRAGLKYVYVGNVHDWDHQSTYCPGCGKLLIARDWYELGVYHLRNNRCAFCDTEIAGRFSEQPGTWGRRREPVKISQFLQPSARPSPSPGFVPVEKLSPSKSSAREATMSSSATGPARDVPVDASADLATAPAPRLTNEQQQAIHRLACQVIAEEILARGGEVRSTLGDVGSLRVEGAFVTLKRRGHLRGCCGVLGGTLRLDAALFQSAARTALHDLRMPPVALCELPHLDLDVTLLHNFRKLEGDPQQRRKAVHIGRHGLQIRLGENSGLLLPSVAVEHKLDAEQFLQHVCRKAGLRDDSWQSNDAELMTFEGLVSAGPFAEDVAQAAIAAAPLPLSDDELAKLAEHCRRNVLANLIGATPNYYLSGVSDRTVPGVVLTVSLPGTTSLPLAQLSLRPGVPLQATLYNLTVGAADWLKSRQIDQHDLQQLKAGVSVVEDVAMHGSVQDPDLRGFDPRLRALLINEHQKTNWLFSPGDTTEALFDEGLELAAVTDPAAARLYSLRMVSTEKRLIVGSSPRPQPVTTTRPAAVAGSFYPAEPERLQKLLDELLEEHQSVTKEEWPAAMTPHAGLMYSGRIAAAVWSRLKLPETIIVIGPKHTRNGVNWAVSPHECWTIPGATIPGDPQLARKLVEHIPGLQLDAAAHRNEHAIEVELPFIARFAPQSRVVGIAIGACSLEQSLKFAEGLAGVLRPMSKRPLLMISSDMNHFASDEENRRLDEIALAALERLEPRTLFETIVGQRISMCGVVPAVIVMETLRLLGGLHTCRRLAYGTSGDVSGDRERVVGYASLVLA